jgi:hypothetical protein
MGVAEVVIIAGCWVAVAALMLWGVFTERNRDGVRRRSRDWQPAVAAPRNAASEWIVLESTAGSGPGVEVQARLIASALLASRGIDLEALPPGDLRIEATTASDGAGTTRVLVRAGAMHASRRRQ